MLSFTRNKTIAGTLGTAALATVLVLMFTPPLAAHPQTRIQVAFVFPIAILGLGAASFFLRSLKTFKPGLRVPYTLLSLGILMVPFPEALVATIIAFSINASKLPILSIFTALSLTLAAPLIYFGMRKFAQLVSVHNIWTKLKFIIPGITVMSTLFGMYGPNLIIGHSGPQYIASYFITANSILYAVVATILALRIKALLGPAYESAMQYLTAAVGMTALAYIHDTITAIIFFLTKSTENWYLAYTFWPYLISNLLFLYSGYQFWKTSRQVGNNIDAHATYIDTITSMASLVSNPRALDVSLDKLRTITASGKNDAALSPKDRAILLDLYFELESYLTTKDPLRTYNVEELRSHLTYDFQQALKAHPRVAPAPRS